MSRSSTARACGSSARTTSAGTATATPTGLAGTDIPLAARVFAVADALDAITSDRPYRRARRWVDAGRELVQQSGKQFDPDVVGAFVGNEAGLRAIRDELESAGR